MSDENALKETEAERWRRKFLGAEYERRELQSQVKPLRETLAALKADADRGQREFIYFYEQHKRACEKYVTAERRLTDLRLEMLELRQENERLRAELESVLSEREGEEAEA